MFGALRCGQLFVRQFLVSLGAPGMTWSYFLVVYIRGNSKGPPCFCQGSYVAIRSQDNPAFGSAGIFQRVPAFMNEIRAQLG